MEQAPGLGLLTTDRELVVSGWNAWLATATGLRESQVRGLPLLELIPTDRRSLYREVLDDVLERGTSRVLAPTFHHYIFPCPPSPPSPHFEHMQQKITVAPLRASGDVVGVMVTVEDMTAALDDQRALAARMREGDSGIASGDILAAVGAEDWRVRAAAVRELKQSASPEDIAHLLASLERDHQSLDVLSSALDVLTSANRDVVEPLMTLLADPHANLRMHAALALGYLRDGHAVPALVRALDDGDANVRFHAIEALGRIAAPEAVEPLTRIAESGDFFLAFPAIDALARTDDPRVIPSLIGLLQNDLLRPAVVDTLAALGDEECVAPLVDVLNTCRGEAAPVAAALEQIRERYERTFASGDHIVGMVRAAIRPEALRHLSGAIARREMPLAPLIVVIGWIGGDAATQVLVTLVGEPGVRTQIANAILAIGRAAVPPLIQALETTDRAGRLAATTLLGRLGERRAVSTLIGLLTEADAELVASAAASLATLGDSRAVHNLMPLFGSEHAAVRQAAIAAVNALGPGAAEPSIRDLLTDGDPSVRECAIRVAGYFGFDSSMPRILESLDDPDEDVRRAAIEQMPVIDHPDGASRLATAIRDETARNRAAAAHAARACEDPRLDAPLIAALADQEPWVRYFAAGSLGQRGHVAATDVLTQLAATDPAPQVRIAAIQALGLIDPDVALPLADQLLDGANDDVSCAAIAAIAAARSQSVDSVLERAIRSTSTALRGCAVDALATRHTMAAVDSLAWAARMTEPPAIARAAVDALSSIAGRQDDEVGRAAISALIEVGIEPSRRQEVVEVLSRVGGETIDVVAEALADSRVAARLTTVEALARMRNPRASAALAAALRDANPDVRMAAIAGFGRLGTPGAASAICEMRDHDRDPAVRRRAAIVCHRYGWGR